MEYMYVTSKTTINNGVDVQDCILIEKKFLRAMLYATEYVVLGRVKMAS